MWFNTKAQRHEHAPISSSETTLAESKKMLSSATKKTQLMGILNVTSNSFYPKSRARNLEKAVEMGLRLEREGADILDIGGESSRPGALPISEEEEYQRVIPLILELKKTLKIPISIDTMKPPVALAAAKAGANWINDITGFSDLSMIKIAADNGLRMCVMHMKGTPKTMQENPQYEEGVVSHLLKWFEEKIAFLLERGVRNEQIVLDPGIGFGKTVADNIEIIDNLYKFKELGFPVLLGISRKSFLSKILNKPAEDLLSATLSVNTIAIAAQVDIIRVHDVKEHRDVIDTISFYHAHCKSKPS